MNAIAESLVKESFINEARWDREARIQAGEKSVQDNARYFQTVGNLVAQHLQALILQQAIEHPPGESAVGTATLKRKAHRLLLRCPLLRSIRWRRVFPRQGNSRQKRPRSKNQDSPDQSSTPSLSVTTYVRPVEVTATPSGLSVIQPLVAMRWGSRS